MEVSTIAGAMRPVWPAVGRLGGTCWSRLRRASDFLNCRRNYFRAIFIHKRKVVSITVRFLLLFLCSGKLLLTEKNAVFAWQRAIYPTQPYFAQNLTLNLFCRHRGKYYLCTRLIHYLPSCLAAFLLSSRTVCKRAATSVAFLNLFAS